MQFLTKIVENVQVPMYLEVPGWICILFGMVDHYLKYCKNIFKMLYYFFFKAADLSLIKTANTLKL